MRLFKDAKYQFLQHRKKAYWLSGIIIGAGLIAMTVNLFTLGNWQNYGVDFTGGTLVQVEFEQEITDDAIRQALGGQEAPRITQFGPDPNDYTIRMPLEEGVSLDDLRAGVSEQLEAAGLPAFEVVRTEAVGAQIGEELEQRAGIAILLSFFLTLIYLAFRFEFRFGLASVITTVHDILIILGILALFRMEIMLPTVAAVLTVIGYSLNDTIVTFDRVRENLNKKGGKREDREKLINRSVNEVLPRTVVTSVTTLAVLAALLVLGPAVIREFTIVLILGILIGTYSSIFVAAPGLLEIERWWERRKEREQERDRERAKEEQESPAQARRRKRKRKESGEPSPSPTG